MTLPRGVPSSIYVSGSAAATATDTIVLNSATLAIGSLVDVNVSLAVFGDSGVSHFNVAQFGSAAAGAQVTSSFAGLGGTMSSAGSFSMLCPSLWSPSGPAAPGTYQGTCTTHETSIQPVDMTITLEIGRAYTFTHSLVSSAIMDGFNHGAISASARASLYFSVLGDASLSSESGASYANTNQVAEPTCVFLIGGALAAIALRRPRVA